jgi:DNA polymerase-3 subunit epsilon
VAERQIVLDTETTGLNAKLGDRVIEIGCIELLSRRVTERHFHTYLDPEREIEEGAAKVHGLTREFLSDKPRFAEMAKDFLDYVRGAELIIHNAAFDVEFLDAELELAGLGRLADHVGGVVDTLALARELHPGRRNSLDALCERYGVDNAHRTMHGALLDARLLAEVYLAMTRGQESLAMDLDDDAAPVAGGPARFDTSRLVVVRASAEEAAAHEKLLDRMEKEAKKGIVWRRG